MSLIRINAGLSTSPEKSPQAQHNLGKGAKDVTVPGDRDTQYEKSVSEKC